MARHRKIDVRIWGDEKFRRLSAPQPNGQTLWVYLLTGPHSTSIPGLFVAGEAMLSEALGWPVKAFRKAFREALNLGMVESDFSNRVLWIPKAVFYNQPESPNVVKSWRAYWDEIPECALKHKAHQHLKAFLEGLGEAFGEAFARACSMKFEHPSPNQEQEQEQEKIAASAAGGKGPEQKEPEPKEPTSRQKTDRDLIFDAIVKVTGADASLGKTAAHIGKVIKTMLAAKPPYTAQDVLALPKAVAVHKPWAAKRLLTIGEVEKYIPVVRANFNSAMSDSEIEAYVAKCRAEQERIHG